MGLIQAIASVVLALGLSVAGQISPVLASQGADGASSPVVDSGHVDSLATQPADAAAIIRIADPAEIQQRPRRQPVANGFDYGPYFARPPPAESALHVYDNPSHFFDPAFDSDRAFGASAGLKVRGVAPSGLVDDLAVAACRTNSFVPGTWVLMADGSSKPIEDVEIGDYVWATDPETGEAGPRRVIDTIVGDGEKDLVDVQVDGDVITATDQHPFWVDDQGRWIDAEDLTPGDQLELADGTTVAVEAIANRVAIQRVHNLTVDGIHTYFVVAGDSEVLVHNCIRGTQGLEHSFDRHSAQWFGRPVSRSTHLDEWTSLLERASGSSQRFNWQVGNDLTTAHLARIDGKPFVVQFFREGPRAGELATAFVPNQRQLSQMYAMLGSG